MNLYAAMIGERQYSDDEDPTKAFDPHYQESIRAEIHAPALCNCGTRQSDEICPKCGRYSEIGGGE